MLRRRPASPEPTDLLIILTVSSFPFPLFHFACSRAVSSSPACPSTADRHGRREPSCCAPLLEPSSPACSWSHVESAQHLIPLANALQQPRLCVPSSGHRPARRRRRYTPPQHPQLPPSYMPRRAGSAEPIRTTSRRRKRPDEDLRRVLLSTGG